MSIQSSARRRSLIEGQRYLFVSHVRRSYSRKKSVLAVARFHGHTVAALRLHVSHKSGLLQGGFSMTLARQLGSASCSQSASTPPPMKFQYSA